MNSATTQAYRLITYQLTQQVLRFFLPWACAGCRTALPDLEDVGFCGRCWLSVPRIEGLVCRFCGVPLPQGGGICFPCRKAPPRIQIRAAVAYRGLIPNAIYRFKYAGRCTLADSFSVLLTAAFEQYFHSQPVDRLVPVPLYHRNKRLRGYNQASLLAQALGSRLRIPVDEDLLVRSKPTRPQFRLTRDERQKNLQKAFSLNTKTKHISSIKGLSLILVDDICTTGATLAECARPLRRAGARCVKALVLARDL